MDETRRCPGCFSVVENLHECSCGYLAADRPPLALKPMILLNEQYLVGRVLGKPGGFGITYLGWDIRLETLVAIKEYLPRDLAGRSTDQLTISPYSNQDREHFQYGMEQFLGEARILARFDHPNIVRVRSFFEQNETAYLVMDYLKGTNIAEHVAKAGGWVGEQEARTIMLPVLDGLREIHSKGILHRDIKPQNIYLTETGRPILLDFGAARQAMSERSQNLSVVYTAGFAPFEQYHRKGYLGPWTDVYACSATLYFLVTGQTPADAFERVSVDEVLAPFEINKSVSKEFAEVVMKGLAIRPEDRPQDVFLFSELLTGNTPTSKNANIQKQPDIQNTRSLPEKAEHKNLEKAEDLSGANEAGPSFWQTKRKSIVIAASILLLMGAMGFVWNQANSKGSITFADGKRYTGDIRWGKATGNGSMIFPSGREITGPFQDGVPSGTVALQLPEGYRYEGALINDKRNGFGKLINKNQQVEYEGLWANDKRNGNGTALYSDGIRFTGEFVNDKREGNGKLVSSSGQTMYEGSWKNDQIDGHGKLWYSDRSRYEGEIKEGRRNGYGKLYNPDGKLIYEGEWANNLRHGKGTMIAGDGTRKDGAWNYDSFVEPKVVQTAPPQPTQPSQPSRSDTASTTPGTDKRRDVPRQKKSDPTPQEVFGAFFDLVNKLEKR